MILTQEGKGFVVMFSNLCIKMKPLAVTVISQSYQIYNRRMQNHSSPRLHSVDPWQGGPGG
jgi:hypothetical protein